MPPCAPHNVEIVALVAPFLLDIHGYALDASVTDFI
jgi:hypothetical protein